MFRPPPPVYLTPPGAELVFVGHFFEDHMAQQLFQQLKTTIAWKEEPITLFGKTLMQPRLVAWYGDAGSVYTYSGKTNYPLQWTAPLLLIKNKVEAFAQHHFNSCLLNLYRTGADSMGWHSDDERELGINPIIASVSFGAMRTFKMQHKSLPNQKLSLQLSNGSLLLMRGCTQHNWKHAVPKTTMPTGERINLTFRWINY